MKMGCLVAATSDTDDAVRAAARVGGDRQRRDGRTSHHSADNRRRRLQEQHNGEYLRLIADSAAMVSDYLDSPFDFPFCMLLLLFVAKKWSLSIRQFLVPTRHKMNMTQNPIAYINRSE